MAAAATLPWNHIAIKYGDPLVNQSGLEEARNYCSLAEKYADIHEQVQKEKVVVKREASNPVPPVRYLYRVIRPIPSRRATSALGTPSATHCRA